MIIKTNRIISLLLALVLVAVLLASCTGSPDDRCVKVDGDTISIPSMNLSFSFPAPWFTVTNEEIEAISQDKELLRNYVDEDGDLVNSRPEAYTTDEVLLLNGQTLETCRISAKEDLNSYSLESFASNLFDKMQGDMDLISLPQSLNIGKYKGYAISTIPKDSTLRFKYYYLHEKKTFVEIVTSGYSDHVKVEKIIEE